MDTTRASLLHRIKDPGDNAAWREFRDLYGPLLYRYARARWLSREDAEEVRDECLLIVSREIPGFEYDRDKGGFKCWLRRIAGNKVTDLLRRRREFPADTGLLAAVPDSGPQPDELWEQHWREEHLRYCVRQVCAAAATRDRDIFERLVFEERPVSEICASLGVTANQVHKAKSRILHRLRALLSEFEAGD